MSLIQDFFKEEQEIRNLNKKLKAFFINKSKSYQDITNK